MAETKDRPETNTPASQETGGVAQWLDALRGIPDNLRSIPGISQALKWLEEKLPSDNATQPAAQNPSGGQTTPAPEGTNAGTQPAEQAAHENTSAPSGPGIGDRIKEEFARTFPGAATGMQAKGDGKGNGQGDNTPQNNTPGFLGGLMSDVGNMARNGGNRNHIINGAAFSAGVGAMTLGQNIASGKNGQDPGIMRKMFGRVVQVIGAAVSLAAGLAFTQQKSVTSMTGSWASRVTSGRGNDVAARGQS